MQRIPYMKSVKLLLLVLLAGCATKKPSTTTTQGGNYSEDLSVWRPKIEASTETSKSTTDERKPTTYVEPKYTVNKQVDAVLDSIDRINLTRKFVDGYTIQVYSGLKREDALNVKKQLNLSLPEVESEVHYQQPNFKVKVGKYYTRLDAQKDYHAVKKIFTSAIVIPEKIPLN